MAVVGGLRRSDADVLLTSMAVGQISAEAERMPTGRLC
jgi:hypothetical protein